MASTASLPLSRPSSQFALRFEANRLDPFHHPSQFLPTIFKVLVASAFVRTAPIALAAGLWAVIVCAVYQQKPRVTVVVQPVLLTVVGSVLGFIIAFRTSSSFERYNDGRRFWQQIVLAARTFAQGVWIYVPGLMPPTPEDKDRSLDERRSRVIIEKKSAINLAEAFAVAVKHYLRAEHGIYYADMYHLIKFLPAFSLPEGYTHAPDPNNPSAFGMRRRDTAMSTSSSKPLLNRVLTSETFRSSSPTPTLDPHTDVHTPLDPELLPARLPHKVRYYENFPFTMWTGHRAKSRRRNAEEAARQRLVAAQNHEWLEGTCTRNLPLEITMYLNSYVFTLCERKILDVPRMNLLISAVTQMVDALTGLERIATTPLPFSYSMHLWVVTALYCFFMPFQLWPQLRWVAVPATMLVTFAFFGFIVAGEEIENPFGYDKNDLDLDHFTHNIIHAELLSVTSRAPPRPEEWAFAPDNDRLFWGAGRGNFLHGDDAKSGAATPAKGGAATPPKGGTPGPMPMHMLGRRLRPEEWAARAPERLQAALAGCVYRAPGWGEAPRARRVRRAEEDAPHVDVQQIHDVDSDAERAYRSGHDLPDWAA